MKKFISSILILGFTVMPMSYVAFAQEETKILSEVQNETETESIQAGTSDKEQKDLEIQEDNDIDKKSEDIKEEKDAQFYTEKVQCEMIPELTQKDTQEEKLKDIQKDVKTNEDFKSFQLSPETKSKLKKIAVSLPIVVVGAVVRVFFNYIVKNFEDKFNDCNKVSVESCWSAVKSNVSVKEAWGEYNKCKALAKNEYCSNEYTLMKNAKILDFAFKLGKFILDTYRK